MGRGRYNPEERRRRRADDEYRERDEYDLYEEEGMDPPPVRRATRRLAPSTQSTRSQSSSTRSLPPERSTRQLRPVRAPKKRNMWSMLFTGCALGVFIVVGAAAVMVFYAINSFQTGGSITDLPKLLNTKLYNKDESVKVPLTKITQMLICDRVGNVAMKVDPNVKETVVQLKKTVRASSQEEADKGFKQIVVEVQPPQTVKSPMACARLQATPSATNTTEGTPIATATSEPEVTPTVEAGAVSSEDSLIINTLLPSKDPAANKVDMIILLPTSVMANAESPSSIQVNVEAPQGEIKIEGLSGVLKVKSGTGNISVTRAILANGSQLETGHGDVKFDGFLALPLAESEEKARFLMRTENNIDVTLPANSNITIDANTNLGKITSEFQTPIEKGANSTNYFGPLNPKVGTPAAATLVMNVSSGNITIHKSQVQ